MEPNKAELESNDTCSRLKFALESLQREVPDWVKGGAVSMYGNPSMLNHAVVMLCSTCKGMTDTEREVIIYNAHNKESRELARWWERHQEADRQREAKEEAEKERLLLVQMAESLLRPDQIALLKDHYSKKTS